MSRETSNPSFKDWLDNNNMSQIWSCHIQCIFQRPFVCQEDWAAPPMLPPASGSVYIYTHIHIYIHTLIHVYIYIYIYIYVHLSQELSDHVVHNFIWCAVRRWRSMLCHLVLANALWVILCCKTAVFSLKVNNCNAWWVCWSSRCNGAMLLCRSISRYNSPGQAVTSRPSPIPSPSCLRCHTPARSSRR